jgi:hypothetical protein
MRYKLTLNLLEGTAFNNTNHPINTTDSGLFLTLEIICSNIEQPQAETKMPTSPLLHQMALHLITYQLPMAPLPALPYCLLVICQVTKEHEQEGHVKSHSELDCKRLKSSVSITEKGQKVLVGFNGQMEYVVDVLSET